MYPILICNDTIFYKQKTKKIVNKKELIDIVAKRSGMTKTETESLVTIALETIVEFVAKGERVTLVGFGTFSVSKRAARNGRNPQTGAVIKIKAKKVAKFKAGKELASKM